MNIRNVFFTFLLFASVATLQAQHKRVHVVFKKNGTPVRVYSNMDDYIPFISNKPFYADEVKLTGIDSLSFTPSLQVQKESIYYPVQLPEKHLGKRTVYVCLNKHHALASAVFLDLEACREYAANWKEKYVELPYFYRNEASYDEVARQNRNIYRNK